MVAHELKSPLSAIINYINVILTGMFDDNTPKVHEMLERCKVRGEALLDLVRDLLYINSREVGKVERSLEALDLKAVLASQLEFFHVQADKRRSSRPPGGGAGRLPGESGPRGSRPHLHEPHLQRDQVQPGQGLPYRCHHRRGPVLGRCRHRHRHRDERGGEGEPLPGVLPGEEPKTSGIAGTGLGLATVRRVLSEYNGSVSVETSPDAGSTFTVLFPKE